MRIIISLLSLLFVFSACRKENPEVPIADAGPSQAILASVSTVTVTGTATSNHVGIRSTLWSLYSGPNTPTFIHADQLTTDITGLITGSYIFKFAVIDNNGLQAWDTMTVRCGTPVPISIQPTNNPTEYHFFGGSGLDYSVQAPDLSAAGWTTGGLPIVVRGAEQFDLSTIPPGATIVSALLTLYSNPTPLNGNLVDANFGTDNSMLIKRISTAWNPASVTWATQPSTTATHQVLIPHTNLSMLDIVDVDVTTLINDMMATGNYGFMIQLVNETPYNSRQFCSSRYSDALKHPKLVVNYY